VETAIVDNWCHVLEELYGLAQCSILVDEQQGIGK
jgi:hypothetical protein